MGSFNTFKDISYWILLVPFIIILVLYIYFTPSYMLEKPYGSSLSILIFSALFWSYIIFGSFLGIKRREML